MVRLSVLSRTEYGNQIREYMKSAEDFLNGHCSCPDGSCSVVLTELPSRRIEAVVVRPRPVADSRDWDAMVAATAEYRKIFEKRTPASRIRDSLSNIVGAPLVENSATGSVQKIEWNESFSVGVRRLDEQHKQILAMINQLVEAAPVDVHSEIISELLGRLTAYARQHFETEEELLDLHGYPELAEQKAEHREYRFAVAGLCADAMRHEGSVPKDLLRFLKDWWEHHILESDMKYRSFLKERGVL